MEEIEQLTVVESVSGQLLPAAGAPPPVEERLQALEARAFRHGWQMDRLAGRVHDITTQVEGVRAQVEGLRAEMANLRHDMDANFAQLNSRLDSDRSSTASRLDSLITLVQAVADKLAVQAPVTLSDRHRTPSEQAVQDQLS